MPVGEIIDNILSSALADLENLALTHSVSAASRTHTPSPLPLSHSTGGAMATPEETAGVSSAETESVSRVNDNNGVSDISGDGNSLDSLINLLTQQLSSSEIDNHNKVSISIGFAGDGVYSHPSTTLALCGDIDEFFHAIDRATSNKNWTDGGRIALSRKYCFGEAANAGRLAHKLSGDDYNKFKSNMKGMFPKIISADDVADQIQSARRKQGETLGSFLIRLLTLRDQLDQLEPERATYTLADVVKSFLKAMPKRFSKEVTVQDKQDPHKLLKKALTFAEHHPESHLTAQAIREREKIPSRVAFVAGEAKEKGEAPEKHNPSPQSKRAHVQKLGTGGDGDRRETRNNEKRENSSRNGREAGSCLFCGMRVPNHEPKNCFRNPRNTRQLQKGVRGRTFPSATGSKYSALNRVRSSNTYRPQGHEEVTCFKCGGLGHIARKCSSPGDNYKLKGREGKLQEKRD